MSVRKQKWVTIKVETWTDNWQANDYMEILKSGEHKLKIRLHHDSAYANQCYARVERWDGTKWHNVASEGRPQFPGQRKGMLVETDFRPLREKLLRLAEEIIF